MGSLSGKIGECVPAAFGLKQLVTSALLVACGFPVPESSAHEYWLSPSSYSAIPGQTVSIQAFVGSDFKGELRPFAATRTVRLEIQTATRNDVKSDAINGDLNLANLTIEDEGGVVVGFETNFVPITLPADQFDEYLRKEGLDGPLEARQALGAEAGPGRERYARCAKTWIAGRDRSRLRQAFGMPLEIIPRNDPRVPGPVEVQVLYNSAPLEGTLVKVWNQPLAGGAVPREQSSRDPVESIVQARSDANGIAVVRIDSPGEWLISTVHMVPSRDKTVADWESIWASFTFGRWTIR